MTQSMTSGAARGTMARRGAARGRWQALAIAALIVAGTVAVPAAAEASTSRSCWNNSWRGSCTLSTTVKNEVRFTYRGTGPWGTTFPYAVKTTSGRTLCQGYTASGSTRYCYVSYSGPVTISISMGMFSTGSLTKH
ncbi:hypothetical protein [Microbacterium sp. 179-I 3D4 NHS]|uniref:hypothetical protein n=1 Tax=Microbacterium sp. 179-I 3D4 NHS TaxID=3142381 RepID=UPI0039A01DAD